MRRPLRVGLVLDPFRRLKRSQAHAGSLTRELLGRGHLVKSFGISSGQSGSGVDGRGITANLSSFAPDVVVAYSTRSPAAWRGARVAAKLQVPLVVIEESFPARGRTLGRLLRGVGGHLWGASVRKAARRAVALDPMAQVQLLERGYERERVRMIAPGVDLEQYRPGLASHLPAAHGVHGRILLACTPLREGRGLDHIVRAFADTVGRGGGWSLVLAGDGPAGPSLRALAHQAGVGANVHWLPTATREMLPGLFGAATLMLAPHEPSDPGGWRLARAMACGLPVLAERSLLHTTMLEDDGCGLIVDGLSARGWADAIRRSAVAPSSRRRWRLRARELAESRHSWPLVAEKIEGVLLGAVEDIEPSMVPAPERT